MGRLGFSTLYILQFTSEAFLEALEPHRIAVSRGGKGQWRAATCFLNALGAASNTLRSHFQGLAVRAGRGLDPRSGVLSIATYCDFGNDDRHRHAPDR